MVIRHQGDGRWESVPVLAYKEAGNSFKDVTRQVLFEGSEQLPCQLRCFEVAPGGYSTLEKHQHVHLDDLRELRSALLISGLVME